MKIEFKQFAFDVKAIEDTGKFSGYGSVFDFVDFGNDVVVKGAFDRSIEENKSKNRKFPALWQHDPGEPLTAYDNIFEDDAGLVVEGTLLINDVQKAKEAHALMKVGAVTGLSIGYGVRDSYEKDGVRYLTDLDLYEVSLVTFPMNDEARVQAVKSRLREGVLPSLKGFEDFLCEAGFSRTQSKAIANGGLSKLLRCEAVTDEQANTLELLKSFQLPTLSWKENSNVQ